MTDGEPQVVRSRWLEAGGEKQVVMPVVAGERCEGMSERRTPEASTVRARRLSWRKERNSITLIRYFKFDKVS